MIFKNFNGQERYFFYFVDFIWIYIQKVDEFLVNRNVFILIAEGFQGGCMELGLGLYLKSYIKHGDTEFSRSFQRNNFF